MRALALRVGSWSSCGVKKMVGVESCGHLWVPASRFPPTPSPFRGILSPALSLSSTQNALERGTNAHSPSLLPVSATSTLTPASCSAFSFRRMTSSAPTPTSIASLADLSPSDAGAA